MAPRKRTATEPIVDVCAQTDETAQGALIIADPPNPTTKKLDSYELDPKQPTSIVCGSRVVFIGRGVRRIHIEMRGD